ncbi:RIP metalloprotease RseP [Myxococcota bacterium]|nr:RIP metalloprotease RseP [Myxococcota bacterium]
MSGGSSYLFAFVVMLGVLVFVHELGHFLVAKLFGVRVLKFSLGFGPAIGFGRFRMRWIRGHTEYVVAAIPLGGFVKMLGETGDEEEDLVARAHPDETLTGKPTWQKLAVVLAGPCMNLIFPVLVYTLLLGVGIPKPDSTLGAVEPGSPGVIAGLLPGDQITFLDGQPVEWWKDVSTTILDNPDRVLDAVYEREGVRHETRIQVGERSSFDEFGTVQSQGWAGLEHSRLLAMVALPSASAPALAGGLRSGDIVKSVAGDPVDDWYGFETAVFGAGVGGVFEVTVDRGDADAQETVSLKLPAMGSVSALGAIPAAVLVASVSPDSPAERAGLETGDIVLSVDGEPMGTFSAFSNQVRTSEGRTLDLRVSRDGNSFDLDVTPELSPLDNGLSTEDAYLVGISVQSTTLPGEMKVDQSLNPMVSIPRATAMTFDLCVTMVRGVGKLITGEVSRKNLAGPIGIAQIAGNALKMGWEYYLQVMVFISVNLGILNLLPIPILDGGQALIYSIEGIRRQPMSLRMREAIQQVGLTMLVFIMALAFWNDISRHWSSVLEWLRSGSGL